MKLTIRFVNRDDYHQLSTFFESNNTPEIVARFNPFPLSSKTAEYISVDRHLDRYYIATIDNEIVSLAMLRGWEEGYEIPSFGILVDQRYQHQGIGKKLTCFVLEEAENMGCEKVRLSVYDSNHIAVHLYKSLGFVEVSREKVNVNGESDIRIIMIKEMEIE